MNPAPNLDVQERDESDIKSRRALFRLAGGAAAVALLAACKSTKDKDPAESGSASGGY